jgi:hypothetical protein
MGTGLPTFRRGDNWSDQDSHQFNRLVDEVRGGMVTSVGPGLRMTRVPPFGTSIALEPKLAKKIEAAAPISLASFRVWQTAEGILLCVPFGAPDPEANSDLIGVAKPYPFHRAFYHDKTFNGVTYTNRFGDQRNATIGATTVCEVIAKPYHRDDIILAAFKPQGLPELNDNLGRPMEWWDVNWLGRSWARQNNTTGACP